MAMIINKKTLRKLTLVILLFVLILSNSIPVRAFPDFYSDTENQFYDKNACDPNGGSGNPDDTTATPVTGVDYDNTKSVETGYEVSVESDGADGSASGDSNYESGTSYGNNLGWKTHFIALYPGWAKEKGLKLGDVVKITWKGKTVFAIYGDNGWADDSNKNIHTEVSLSVKRDLGAGSSAATGFGSKSDPVKFTIYPNTNQKIRGNPPSQALIDKVGAEASGVSVGSEPTSTGGCVCSNPSSGSTTTLEGANNEEKVWNYFIDKGLSPEQVAGIMGNISQESGFDPMNIQNPGGRTKNPASISAGWGLIQWTPGSKIIDIAKKAKITTPIYELGTQLDIVWWHMNNTSPTGVINMLEKYKKVKDEAAATAMYEDLMEGAGKPAIANRIAAAKAALKKYGGGASSGTISSSGDCTSAGGDSSTGGSGTCSVNRPVVGAGNGGGDQYTRVQLAKIFGNPGTESSRPDMDKNLTTVDFNGNRVSVNKKAAGCLSAVAADIKSRTISYKINSMGCYRFDSDNGADSGNIGLSSYHSYGVACDINPDKNPFTYTPKPYDMPKEYVDAFRDNGWTWGGSWSSVKDYMHFEFNGIKP